ncbi:MAG: ABC transporter ATP-binding protein [Victivallaceae bacterium]|nr:ABC transporter ATP-binding protein [Victivallaceae bacterium]
MELEIRNLTKSFWQGEQEIPVFRDLSHSFSYGMLNYITGPSGCGKSTFLNIIATLLKPDSGKVILNGVDLTTMNESDSMKFRCERIGIAFQRFNLLKGITALDNICMALMPLGVSFANATKIAIPLVEKLGIGSYANRKIDALSAGQMQRVSLARALVKNPEILLCDEPTASVDAFHGEIVMQLLKTAAVSARRLVLVVTHDSRITKYADDIYEMPRLELKPEEREKC